MPHKIAVIGAGSVGAAISYALLLRSQVAELHLVDVDTARCQAEVADLSDGTFISNARILCSTLHQAAKCDIIIITAGAKQRDGETRLQLVERNFNILRSIIDGMKSAPAGGIRSDAVLMLVANPVDILTYFAWKLSGLPWGQVFGTGTMLDSMRLRLEIAQRAKVAYTAVHAYVLGEHGDSQMVAWSAAHISNIPIQQFEGLDPAILCKIAESTKNKAYEIIRAKGATYFGIASVVSSLCESIILDQKHIRPLSVYQDDWKSCLSLPAVIGAKGVERVLPVPLNDNERSLLQQSADRLRSVIEQYQDRLV